MLGKNPGALNTTITQGVFVDSDREASFQVKLACGDPGMQDDVKYFHYGGANSCCPQTHPGDGPVCWFQVGESSSHSSYCGVNVKDGSEVLLEANLGLEGILGF